MRIYFTKYWDFGKERLLGNWLHNPKQSVQEHLETIYYIGWLRIIIKHDLKFIRNGVSSYLFLVSIQNK